MHETDTENYNVKRTIIWNSQALVFLLSSCGASVFAWRVSGEGLARSSRVREHHASLRTPWRLCRRSSLTPGYRSIIRSLYSILSMISCSLRERPSQDFSSGSIIIYSLPIMLSTIHSLLHIYYLLSIVHYPSSIIRSLTSDSFRGLSVTRPQFRVAH